MVSQSTAGMTASEAAARIGVPERLVRSLVREGFLSPARDESGDLRFSFQDLVLLRTAKGLLDQAVPASRLRKALAKLKTHSPDRPLSGVRLGVEARRIVVRDGRSAWCAESGQTLLALDTAELGAPVRLVPVAPVARPLAQAPEPTYEAAVELEESDPAAAEVAYRALLERTPDHADAHVNLGRLLQERGAPADAEVHYRRALQLRPADAIAAYNLGTVLEDQQRFDEAMQAYAHAITLDPHCADAHYNLARLHERAGEKTAAIRHLKSARSALRRS